MNRLNWVSVVFLLVSAFVLIRTWAPIGPTAVQKILFSGVGVAVVLALAAAAFRWSQRARFLPWFFPAFCLASVGVNVWLLPLTREHLPITRRADDTLLTAADENNHPLIKKDLGFYYWLRTKLGGHELVYTPQTRKFFDLLLIRSAARLTLVPLEAFPPAPAGRIESLLNGPIESSTLYDGTKVRISLDARAKRYVLVQHAELLLFLPESAWWDDGTVGREPR